jgi:hypothetical protein
VNAHADPDRCVSPFFSLESLLSLNRRFQCINGLIEGRAKGVADDLKDNPWLARIACCKIS